MKEKFLEVLLVIVGVIFITLLAICFIGIAGFIFYGLTNYNELLYLLR